LKEPDQKLLLLNRLLRNIINATEVIINEIVPYSRLSKGELMTHAHATQYKGEKKTK
jgi:hypothetical protein